MKLTRREKVLLIMLLFVALVGLSTVYVFIPKLESVSAKRTEASELQMQLSERQVAAAKVQQTHEELEQAETEGARIYSAAAGGKNYEVSLLLSDMMGRHGLLPLRLSIQEIETEEAAGAQTAENAEEAEEAAVYYTLRDIALTFGGTRQDAMAFVDELAGYDPALLLYGVTIEEIQAGTEYTVQLSLYEFAAPAAAEEAEENAA